MDSVWDLPTGPEGFRQQSWYIRLGRGASFRALNLPLVLTRKMEHYVRQAPDHYTVSQALRYGETRGLGGSEELAREIVAGRLGQKIEHPDLSSANGRPGQGFDEIVAGGAHWTLLSLLRMKLGDDFNLTNDVFVELRQFLCRNPKFLMGRIADCLHAIFCEEVLPDAEACYET